MLDRESEKNEATDSPSKVASAKKRKRKIMFMIFIVILAVSCLIAAGYWYFIASCYITTDNAYVAAEIAQITPSIDGTVKTINVVDTQFVKSGDVVVMLDDIDTRLALIRAMGTLDKARTDIERAEIDLKRRKTLESSGSVSGEEVTNAVNAYRASKAAHDTAKAAVEQAKINLGRTVIRSPVDGVIAKREVQLGQRVGTGTPLMSIVPIKNVYVNANFKENQLSKVRIGQPVKLRSDLHGTSVEFHGRVEGLSGGTGSVFSLIPAQNATGNWIKVIQRVPVRIKLDPNELKSHPLFVGLSMYVTIDTRGR